jgi:protein HIRA/HIR1
VVLLIFILGDRRPGREDQWNPNVASLAKRDLLKDVLSVFCMFPLPHYRLSAQFCPLSITARSKTLAKLAIDWQDMLKKAASDEQFM